MIRMKKMNSITNMKKQLKRMKLNKFMNEFAHDILDIAEISGNKLKKVINKKSVKKKYRNMIKGIKKR